MKVVVLAGGVGGAKLADGFAQVLSPEALTIVVNTGDDFTHLGLKICPDLDTVMYTLAGQDNEVTGWGRSGESWRVIEEVGHRGGPDWFKLGDLDLATHLVRSDLLQQGASLTTVTRQLCSSLGVKTELLPMSDQVAPTMIRSGDDTLSFQEWFVHMKWQPKVDNVLLPDNVNCSREVASAIAAADVVFIAPSNPFVSVDPILNAYPVRAMLEDLPRLVVAVSPIVAGQAIKGPAAKMMVELGMEASAEAVANHYRGLMDIFVIDQLESDLAEADGSQYHRTDTIMNNRQDRIRLADELMKLVKGRTGG